MIGCGSGQFSDQAESDSVIIDTNQVIKVIKQDGFEVETDLLEPSLDSSDVQVVDLDFKPVISLNSDVSPVSLLQSSSQEPLAAEEPEVESVDDILKQLDSINLEDGSGISLGDPDKVAGLLGEGNNLINVGNIDGALGKYQEALKFADGNDDPDVRFNMGIAYKAKGKPDKAIAEYRKAIELAPEYSEAHNNLGNILKDKKNFNEAIYHFDASLKIFPENPSTHNNLGTVYAMKGEISEAVTHFAKAIRIQPTYFDARQNLGFAYMQQGELFAAEREFSQAVEMATGGMAFEHKRLEAAKARLASGLNPQDRKVTENEISTAAKAGRIAANRYSRAMSYLQRVREELSKLTQP